MNQSKENRQADEIEIAIARILGIKPGKVAVDVACIHGSQYIGYEIKVQVVSIRDFEMDDQPGLMADYIPFWVPDEHGTPIINPELRENNSDTEPV